MSELLDKIRNVKGLRCARRCTEEELKQAQIELGLNFPEEYKEYVSEFGCIDFGVHEWTGLHVKGYLNTVTATKSEIEVNQDFPAKCFVLEDLNIDAKKVIVNEEGKVYLLQLNQVTPLCGSISEYLDMCTK
ncbi:SMI1/KNR4 family protein [Dialister sp.]|uniref:SMI1/KNR4 family protein n=1 Tax=Dialister sp. TaxID=1955814 RepID=UPI002E80F370|nr:SMI1/KNR4 family protein [Dialister sp.]MEE3452839.1 SMI1/KNR4 family protein [Dialister sp.]